MQAIQAMRNTFPEARVHPAIAEKIADHRKDQVAEVQALIAAHRVVVVGMAQNPHPKKARRLLDAKGIAYQYLEIGSYLSGYQPRLVLKMWTGWPTFPMIFVDGTLIGGASDLQKLADSGELAKTLAAPRAN
ncbi:MAG: glutaredoxin [Polyangiaceae bacterium]